MALTIHSEEDSERQLQVTVEVPEDRVQAQMRRTARTLAKEIRFPGFRRGKVPYNVLVNRVGEKALRADAVEEMIESVFMEAIDELGEQAYGQPTLDEVELDPLILKLTVPLEPTVELGDYRTVRKELSEVEVTPEALEEALDQLRLNFQELEEVDRPSEVGDMVTVSGTGRVDEEDGGIIWSEQDTDLLMDPDKTFPDLGFIENITGLSAGEDAEFSVSFPEDYEEEELVGKEALFSVSISKVQSRTIPDLDDDLAKQAGEYETLDELREALAEELLGQARNRTRNELLDGWVDELLTDAKLSYPPAMMDSELDSMVENFKDQITRSGWQWEDFLKLQGETEASLRENWTEGAARRIQRGLVLREFTRLERLEVEPTDIDELIEERLGRYEDNKELQEQLRSVLTQGQGLESMRNDILMEKVIDRVEAIVTGNAPDLAELDEIDDEDDDEEE
ncbi:MAG TPA: trigger factor [candidate division Zixibacteria bacterium]|nr:trigger factor [candidate division Zixibacteria bacterium]